MSEPFEISRPTCNWREDHLEILNSYAYIHTLV